MVELTGICKCRISPVHIRMSTKFTTLKPGFQILDLLTLWISYCARSLTIHGWSDTSLEFFEVNRARRSYSNLVLSWSICTRGMGIHFLRILPFNLEVMRKWRNTEEGRKSFLCQHFSLCIKNHSKNSLRDCTYIPQQKTAEFIGLLLRLVIKFS